MGHGLPTYATLLAATETLQQAERKLCRAYQAYERTRYRRCITIQWHEQDTILPLEDRDTRITTAKHRKARAELTVDTILEQLLATEG